MTDASQDGQVLHPQFLEELRKGLNAPNVYTDEQLNRAAFFFAASPLAIGATIGAADASPAAIMTVANFAAGSILAEFINAGILSVSAIDRYMTKVGREFDEGKLTIPTREQSDDTDGNPSN